MKTTVLGILTIVGAIISGASQFIKNGSIDIVSIVPTISAGIGLIKAADSKK